MIKVTPVVKLDEVREKLKEIVEEFGEDYKYEAPGGLGSLCSYRDEDDPEKPGCIVGHLFHKHYPKLFKAAVESERWGEDIDGFSCLLEGISVPEVPGAQETFDRESIHYLLSVQNAQDTGVTWGEAVNR